MNTTETLKQPPPMPGDVVELTGPYSFVESGELGVIMGTVGVPPPDGLDVCFRFSAFRGRQTGYSGDDKPVYVNASGGPATMFLPSVCLESTGRTRTVRFWRWRGFPCAGGGIDYTLDVPVWEWDGRYPDGFWDYPDGAGVTNR